jgi:hypothetical protein
MNTFCPCCLQKLTVVGVQQIPARFIALNPSLKPREMMHCVNEDCKLYMATTTNIKSTWLSYGMPTMDSECLCGGQSSSKGGASHE